MTDGVVRLTLAGDWGTGTDEARRSRQADGRRAPDFTIHLGDIYFVGTLAEVNEHFLGVDNPHNDFTPCAWPLGEVGSFALAGNHEMYGLGDATTSCCCPVSASGIRGSARAGFFCLENDHWRVVGLDTALQLDRLAVHRDGSRRRTRGSSRSWSNGCGMTSGSAIARTTAGIVLLSHHQYFSAFDEWYVKPAQQLAEFINRPVLWFWGHEHRLALSMAATPSGAASPRTADASGTAGCRSIAQAGREALQAPRVRADVSSTTGGFRTTRASTSATTATADGLRGAGAAGGVQGHHRRGRVSRDH